MSFHYSRSQVLKQLGVTAMASTFGAGLLSACSQMTGSDVPSKADHPILLSGVTPHQVDVKQTVFNGRQCLSIELTDAAQQSILRKEVNASNGPTYAILSDLFNNGTIEVDIAGEINSKGQADARGFVGIAFHLSEDSRTYEAVYLRMGNGTLNVPPPQAPRNVRAVQYVAHPNFHFSVSRQQAPGRYEKAAPVALGRWHHLKLDIRDSELRASVDGLEVLHVVDLKYGSRMGKIGLWVDDGSRGYFTNMQITKASNTLPD